MRNFLILGLLAVLLFSVSAALSLWLNQSKPTETSADKGDAGGKEKGTTKGPREVLDKPILPKSDDAPGALDSGAILRDRESRLQYRQAQVELVLRDLDVQREATDITLSKVLAEAKNLGIEMAKLDAREKDLKDRQGASDSDEKKNIDQQARVFESMAPESAAAVVKEMVDKGKLETAAKILAQMKERSSARVMDAINDPSIEAQLFERVLKFRPIPPAPLPKAP